MSGFQFQPDMMSIKLLKSVPLSINRCVGFRGLAAHPGYKVLPVVVIINDSFTLYPLDSNIVQGPGGQVLPLASNTSLLPNIILIHQSQLRPASLKIDLADAKYDELNNYAFSRSQGAIPIIDYNPRNENLSANALKNRGHDRNGWPYAPCGLLTRPNGFDFNCQRASFSCRRQCVSSKDPKIAEYAKSCSHWINYHGFTKHMSVHKFPRLITEVIRGTERHQKIKALRSAAERTNATAKDDLCILSKPKVRGLKHAGILSQMAVIVVLLKRVACFIVKVTLALRKKTQNNKSPPKFFLPGPSVPKFILNLVMRE